MSAMVNSRFLRERQNNGWSSPRQYQGGSWLFKRYQATQFAENDFRSRAAGVFATSNLSLSTPKALADTHLDKMIDDMLPSDKFFAAVPEGPEDAANGGVDPVSLAERYLQARARRKNLVENFRDALRACVRRGECVYKATKGTITKYVPVEAKLVLDGDGKPAKDSQGDYITEFDKWLPIPSAVDGAMFLERDPRTKLTIPAGVALPLSEAQKVFIRPETKMDGCDWGIPYWSDIIIPDIASSIDATDFRGHIYDAFPEDVVNGLPADRLNRKAADKYLEQYANTAVASVTQSDASSPAYNRGEQPQIIEANPNTPQKRTYLEAYFRWDADKDGRSEDLMLLLDVEACWPIAYDYANMILDWTDEKTHPFGVYRINPVENRWYGMGYWEVFSDLNYFIDFCWNTIKIDLDQSGNMLFGNPSATEEGMSGIAYRTRTLRLYRTRGMNTPDDALQVKTVPSQSGPMNDMLNTALQRVQSIGGSVASGESPVSGLPGKDTATAANIAQTQSDIMVRAREGEFVKGANPALQDFGDIEFSEFDMDFAIDLLGEENALILSTYLQQKPKDWRSRIALNMTKTRSTMVIDTSMAKISVVERWMAIPPQLQTPSLRRMFADCLRAMDDPDPEAALPLPVLAPIGAMGPDGQQLAADPNMPTNIAPVVPPLDQQPPAFAQAA